MTSNTQILDDRYGVGNYSFGVNPYQNCEYEIITDMNVLPNSPPYKLLPDESSFVSKRIGKETRVYKKTNDVIYRPFALSLGDLWRDLRFLSKLAGDTNSKVKIRTSYVSSRKRDKSVEKKIKEALPLFENSELIELVEDYSTEYKLNWKTAANIARGRTKIKWSYTNSKKVLYQFDGKRVGSLSEDEENKILNFLKDNGYETMKLGWENTLEESVKLLSECKFFIGVSSGFSHIAGTVGCPTILLRQHLGINNFKFLHGNMKYILCDSSLDKSKETLINMKDPNYFFNNCENEI